ncbi:MAG: response regulator [Clostridiaceae bacterium]|nr:response regulator [Clostridiaceae bacterium]
MIHVIAVDENPHTFTQLKTILGQDSRVRLDGFFTDAGGVLEHAQHHLIDFCLLSTDIPGMDSLSLGSRLLGIQPRLHIVMLATDTHSAYDAFRIHASGYLLKPISIQDLREQLDLYLQRAHMSHLLTAESRSVSIRCFGGFHCTVAGEPVKFRTAKAEELLALLVHYQGRPRSKDILVDKLWPNLPPEKSHNLFRVNCTYLRNAFSEKGVSDLLLRVRDSYSIDTDRVNCDLYRFRQAELSMTSLSANELEAIASIYCGEYLESQEYTWASSLKLPSFDIYKSIEYHLAELYSAQCEYKKAENVLLRVKSRDPYDEESVDRLIRFYLSTGSPRIAQNLYQDFTSLLSQALGASPSDKLTRPF